MGAGTVLAAATVAMGGTARAAERTPGRGDEVVRALADLEREHGARLGVFARNTVTGARVRYRADELFPICSVHKIVTAAAVLRDLDRNGEVLARRIRYTAEDVTASGYAPITGTPEHLASGMTVAELCAAALDYSDNAADNLLLRELGGPTAITRFCRSLGDRVTRLDRWEPELNSAEPGRITDTTSPAAIGRTLTDLVLGEALAPRDRRQLTDWMLANTTGAARLRAALPPRWALADKTGTGSHGTTNDVGIAWTADGTPLVLSVLTTKPAADAPADEALIARATALVLPALC
ncbi:class A beta-lactamase [Kitasatospora camelliae]|uniref:Beta-lactamase n=1 Tax=Kitasatospora camelliae TaxID=3156397 RepID=A0AAU8K533_9ACTN